MVLEIEKYYKEFNGLFGEKVLFRCPEKDMIKIVRSEDGKTLGDFTREEFEIFIQRAVEMKDFILSDSDIVKVVLGKESVESV